MSKAELYTERAKVLLGKEEITAPEIAKLFGITINAANAMMRRLDAYKWIKVKSVVRRYTGASKAKRKKHFTVLEVGNMDTDQTVSDHYPKQDLVELFNEIHTRPLIRG